MNRMGDIVSFPCAHTLMGTMPPESKKVMKDLVKHRTPTKPNSCCPYTHGYRATHWSIIVNLVEITPLKKTQKTLL